MAALIAAICSLGTPGALIDGVRTGAVIGDSKRLANLDIMMITEINNERKTNTPIMPVIIRFAAVASN